MCGITGVFDRAGSRVQDKLVETMRDAISHRGPDDHALWSRPERGDVCFGHRRLSIVDLSPLGRQPMANEDGTVQVVFNGMIYNHEELRGRLERRGHVFRSRCDTEVLVHLYEDHGPGMVEHLIGMFAFAIWDERQQRILVARDRLGIKPLYWHDDGERFSFGSEIKALLPVLKRRDIDRDALAHYLTFVAVPPPATLFEGVHKLAPATTMVVDRGGPATPQRYWDPLEHRVRVDDASEVDWAGELRQRLERSVERRMVSDVPVGVFLSGGVDSSTNVALMSRLTDEPVNTFSIAFDDAPEHDELDWARRVAAQFGTNHHETRIDADALWDFLPTLVHHQDEPIADPVCVPLYYVSKLAKDNGVTVVHVGEGADELLAGYPTYVTAERMATGPWRRLRGLPGPARTALGTVGAAVLERLPRYDIHSEVLARAVREEAQLWWGGAVAFYERGLARMTTPSFRGALAGGEGPAALVASIAADATRLGARDELDRIIYQDLRVRLPELLLMRVDKLTMASAVEARVPFLDHELVELAMAMPRDEKIVGGVGKVVLKRAMAGELPHELLWRPKQGFGAPVARWFRGELADRVARSISGSAIQELGILEPKSVDELLRLHASGRAERSFQIWNLLNLAVWFDFWIAGREDGIAAAA